MIMKLDRLAFRSLKRAYHDAERAPGDAKSHARFASWARLVAAFSACRSRHAQRPMAMGAIIGCG
jgi:hypothetical protein